MWSLIVSALAFFIAIWYIRRYLDEQDIPKGMTRSILIFTLASVTSWGAGAAADWVEKTIEEPQPEIQTPDDLSQLLKDAEQKQP
jgi:hypothetical protein